MVVAVTGNMGAGKSTLARMLAAHGARLVDADRLARQVVDESPHLRRALALAFGADLLGADGTLDRRGLAQRALADAQGQKLLEGIVRPGLEARLWREVAAAAGEAEVVVLDAALVFEWGIQDRVDAVILVTADAEVAAQRVSASRGLSAAEVEQRRRRQRPEAAGREGADYVVDNSGDLGHLRAAAARIWQDLMARGGPDRQEERVG